MNERPSYPDVLLHINGRWRPATDGRSSPVANPSSGETIGSFAHAAIADLDEALDAATSGFHTWSQVSAFDRSKLLRRAADLLRERTEFVARLLTLEQGKPLSEARTEIQASADIIDWFAEEARRTYGRIVPARVAMARQLVVKQPVGPVAAFTPWNFPVSQLARKLAAALAAGCSIIVKAAEETPAAPAELVRAFVDAGLPNGAVALVFGTPSEISDHLIAHPAVRKVTFTGSTPVGKQLAALAGQHMKRVTMELGGHAPVIVLKDADLARAATTTIASKFRNAGQVCIAPTRFLIEEPVYDKFVSLFSEMTAKICVGDGLSIDTTMGPLANERRIAAMEAFIQDAVERGAERVCGGSRIGNSGFFLEPTILADVPRDARAMNEEPFGPLALMVPIRSLDDIMVEANRLPYGLAAYAFTQSSASAARIGEEIASGMVSINHAGLALPEVPFGGINDSGYGTEGGADAIEGYLNSKFITHLQT
ncbi:NAD-dependent succinate-semialdehyde dehydrogenase [Chelatococcus asaccharovorans]|uniref:NAD-dependent succinate-semialdehyde dehydrogenase n=1 Tax=Chelatococcus asaccharovorans TaxID=28210 RepID=UPI00224C67FA|nr:NAD-dependent succinate-semialdehyde dehydrogenase [Chelatococcus asaccharovorans]CAH1669171.1 Alpha-ketoglutaric semialdehyde dehydrogenase 1 [Chelatococcus asaccharovorans]CAH1679408.1 Alpha-ketoglutaric semialdehyde dehydrogenase 1 [Chelatococcus asaccharovorans]